MPHDTIITGGTIHTAARSFRADIAIQGEKIAAIGEPGSFSASAPAGGLETRPTVIDAAGMDILPGCIDVHVHLALPFCGTVSCDDFESGSRAAASGCITTLLDFAIPADGQTLQQADQTWHDKARGKSIVDYAWHLAIIRPAHIAEIPAMVKAGRPTFKEFMIYESEGWSSDDAMIYGALEAAKREGGMLLLHAESPRVLDLLIARSRTPELMRMMGARLHATTRPNFVEAEAIERAIRWCEVTGGALYIVHMSTGEGADLVKAARARGVNVWAETCVQYLTLDDSVFERPDGHLFACCPQVKKPADIVRLWDAVSGGSGGAGAHGRDARATSTGEISVVSTDTCSFTREQKDMWRTPEGYGDFTRIPMGLPGLDTMIPIMYTHGVRAGRMSINRLVELCSTNPARLMGLGHRKGDIAPGLDADIAIIDPKRTFIIKPGQPPLQSRCDWSPYQGRGLGGFAHTTLVRGTPVVLNGRVIGEPGHGIFLERHGVGRL